MPKATDPIGGIRDENKKSLGFWIDQQRKADFKLACDRHGLNMTDAFERFVSAVMEARTGSRKAVVDLTPQEACKGGQGVRRPPPQTVKAVRFKS